ncbi:hypothetical protein Dsin_024804 [Dipteronia sinensis]|uniref:glutathione gamma-glutamylcysteinyltransferase n=1 Tax=Dipteronia sinensis TaxID=43782 RepID=A0AAD9ZUZ0_9ROSI|nr:hypothetical protein Dsin_024804 [Dipteronia sinensis]
MAVASLYKTSSISTCNRVRFSSRQGPWRWFDDSMLDSCESLSKIKAEEDYHVIASYHRGVFKQTGSGHFSPIGGYHVGRDMAMNTIDKATGHHRGFMIISRLHKAPSILYTVSRRHEGWRSVAKYLTEDVPHRLKLDNLKDVENVLSVVFKTAAYDLKEFIKWVAEVRRQEDVCVILSEEEKGRLVIMLQTFVAMEQGNPVS